MLTKVFSRLEKTLMTTLLALCLTLVAFSHSFAGNSFDLTAYALPDGSTPVLCAIDDAENKSGLASCEACRLASGFLNPTFQITLLENTLGNGEAIQVSPQLTPRAPEAHNTSSRGPPLIG